MRVHSSADLLARSLQVGEHQRFITPCSKCHALGVPNFSRAAASLKDTKDQFKDRLSQGPRHDRLGLERFKNRVVDEVGEQVW